MDIRSMDVNKVNVNLQNLKEQLKNLMVVSADLIERNSQIDSGSTTSTPQPPPNTLPKFEFLLEEFLSTCNVVEVSLRTMQECLIQGKASLQNLPITVSNMKCDSNEAIEPNTVVSYNQYLTTIKYQVDTAKAIISILDDFVEQQKQNSKNQHQQLDQHQHHQHQHQQQHST